MMALEVVPNDEAVEIIAADIEHSAGCLFREPVGKLHVFLGLRPA